MRGAQIHGCSVSAWITTFGHLENCARYTIAQVYLVVIAVWRIICTQHSNCLLSLTYRIVAIEDISVQAIPLVKRHFKVPDDIKTMNPNAALSGIFAKGAFTDLLMGGSVFNLYFVSALSSGGGLVESQSSSTGRNGG